MHLSIGELAVYLGLSVVTLRRWEKTEKLVPEYRTVGNHRRYSLTAIKQQFNLGEAETKTICYARVSSADQKEQLTTQATRLEQYCKLQGWKNVESISDLGSGLNYKKKGLKNLIGQLLTEPIKRLVIVTKDRLLRFGSKIIFDICKLFGIEVLILDENEPKSTEATLVEDIINLMTVFSAKLYGSRSRKNLKALNKA